MTLSNAPTIAIAITLLFASASAFSKQVVFKPSDQTIATKICLVATTSGIQVAAALASANDINFRQFKSSVACNGLSLSKFAAKYRQDKTSAKVGLSKTATLMANNTNTETQLCLDAVTMGERRARAIHSVTGKVLCNSKDLSDFVSSFNDIDVTIKESTNLRLVGKITMNN